MTSDIQTQDAPKPEILTIFQVHFMTCDACLLLEPPHVYLCANGNALFSGYEAYRATIN